MRVLETSARIVLPDSRVWVCGDWHGNVGWVQTTLPALRRLDAQISTMLHVGDWAMEAAPVDYWCKRAGIDRVLVTLGNHEPYGAYSPLLEAHPGKAVRVSDVVWLLPRPFRFEIGGREFLSLGGAASLDKRWRVEGKDWWPDEIITDADVAAACIGPADVMVTHESPDSTPIAAIARVLEANPHGFPADALEESAASRARVGRVWRAVRPELLVHGHFHITGSGVTEQGQSVVSLGRDGSEGNVAMLDVMSLTVDIPPLKLLRGW